MILGYIIQNDGVTNSDVNQKIQTGRLEWNSVQRKLYATIGP